MAEAAIPGISSLGGDNPTHCPLCKAPVTGSDGLQLHYLTSCKSYDKLSDEQPRSKPRKDPAPSSSSHSNTGHSSQGGVARRDPSTSGSSKVQFMWQPLTDITYPTIMLLTSFEPGSITLKLNADDGYYESAKVSVPNGTFEGQLVIGESFVYPVKKFTVDKPDDIIVLQFDVEQGKELSGGDDLGMSSSGRYGSGLMHQNPSYGGGEVGRSTRSSAISSDLGGGSGGYSYYKEAYQNTSNRTRSSVQPPVTRHTPSYPPVSNENVLVRPPISKNPRTITVTTPVPDNTTSSSSTTRASDNTPRSHFVPTTPDNTVTRSQPTVTASVSSARANTQPSNVTAAPTATGARVGGVPQSSAAGHSHTPSERSGQSSAGFNVGALQQTGAELPTDVLELQQQLEAVKKERDSLVQNQQRVNARWDGRVKRLETELETLRAGGAPSSQDNSRLAGALNEAQAQITRLEGEVSSLKREREEIATNAQGSTELQRELREMKDRNTALEHQMVEYAETVKDQSKYIQSSVARGKQQSAETLVSEQEFIHISAFAKKQQLEHAEALAGLEKKISATSDSIDDTRGLHQLNVRLAAEIEDYREQTKRLLQDIAHKDVEIGRLRESLHSGGSQGSDQLELATLREKVKAYQEEFDNVAFLKNEVDRLNEQTAHQENEIQRLTADNDDLTRQFQAVIDNAEQRDPELSHKASDYDTLLERYHDLQKTRINLENELQPLRHERTTILRENAQLREGSDPQKYAKLKQNYDGLTEHCQQLEAIVADHEDTNREMQTKLDQTTNPEMLQSIRERMERYKTERDASRKKAEEAERLLAEADAEKDETFQKLQEATEQSQRIIDEFQSKLAKQEVVESDRTFRYREERNNYKKRCKDLEKQLAHWKALVIKSEQLHHSRTSDHDDIDYDPQSDHPGSPSSDYHPQAYTDEGLQQYQRESLDSPMSELETGMASLSMEPSKSQRKRNTTGSRPKQISENFEMVDVKTKDGTRVVNVGRPRGGLSAKNKPKVVVKRGEEYEQGSLMWVGVVNGKELAGVHMDIRLSKPSGTAVNSVGNDGTCSDGKRYFKCPMGYGIYVPVSKILLEMESAYV